MKIPIQVECSGCGSSFNASGYGDARIPPATCPTCGGDTHISDRLTISVIADRLLLRSQHEISEGDFTISIICGAIAVECAFSQLFLKWKKMAAFRANGEWPTEEEFDGLTKEYPKNGGFLKIADFVSRFMVGMRYNEFVDDFAKKRVVDDRHAKAEYIKQELFDRRNRIMHWGKTDYGREHADSA